jgi:hypothetical protein
MTEKSKPSPWFQRRAGGARRAKGRLNSTLEPAATSRPGGVRYHALEIAANKFAGADKSAAKKGGTARKHSLALLWAGLFYKKITNGRTEVWKHGSLAKLITNLPAFRFTAEFGYQK